MTEHMKLFTPGPGDVDEEVLEALGQPVIRHYGPEWMEIYNEVIDGLRRIYQTQNDIFIVPGAASALMDMAIGSLVETGQKMIIGTNGFFGDRLLDIAKGYGIEAVTFTAPLGQPLDADDLRKLIRENPEANVVAFVHHETSTTVMNPLRELAQVASEAGKVTIVDAVSSLGGVEMAVDEWGVDVCVTAANKCLESVPGIGFISVSPRAWALIDQQPGTGRGWYLNLRVWRKYAQEWGNWHPSPVTLPVNNIMAVQASMRTILQRGLEAHFARYTNACRTVRSGLANLGFEMLVPEAYASPVVTAVKGQAGFEISELSNWLANEKSMAIGGGLGALAGKIFRVGHLGKAAEREYMGEFLVAVEEFLRERMKAEG